MRSLLVELDADPAANLEEARSFIQKRRGASGAIFSTRHASDVESAVVALRDASRRVPILAFAPAGRRSAALGAIGGVTIVEPESLPHARAVVTSFVDTCASRATEIHEKVNRYGLAIGLTRSEAEFVFRCAMGIRTVDLDDVFGIKRDTKKDRIKAIRDKSCIHEMDDVVACALDNWV